MQNASFIEKVGASLDQRIARSPGRDVACGSMWMATRPQYDRQPTRAWAFLAPGDLPRITKSARGSVANSFRMENLTGKVVIVTGASSGIGEATALLLAGRGAEVVLGARRTDKLEAIVARIVAGGGQAASLALDVTRREDLSRAVTFAIERFGRLDVLVSNAGIAPISRFDDLRVEDWEAMIDVNLRGVLYGIAAALPVFRRQGAGHFVNVVSTSGLKIVPLQGVYAGTKNAVRTISEALRQEAGDKLRVTVVSPGFVRTNLSDSMSHAPEVKAMIDAQSDGMAIPPDAIARAIAFAIEQPAEVDVGDIVVRPTAQS
jgi:NADP-dependent 3-hydroxy acid dehydrogenase YdfG